MVDTIRIQQGFQRINYTSPTRKSLNDAKEPSRIAGFSGTNFFFSHLMCIAFSLIAVFTLSHTSYAQEEGDPLVFQELAGSIEKTLANHRTELSTLKVRVDQMKILERTIWNLTKANDSENTAPLNSEVTAWRLAWKLAQTSHPNPTAGTATW